MQKKQNTPTERDYEIGDALGISREKIDSYFTDKDINPNRSTYMPLQSGEVTFDQQSEKKEFEAVPEDSYTSQLLDVTLRDEPSFADKTVMEKKLNFEFACIEEGEYYGRRFWKSVTPKVSAGGGEWKPSGLYTILCALAGRELTDEECKSASTDFINSFIGSQVRLIVKQQTSKTSGKVYNKIGDLMKVKKQLPAFDPDKVKKPEESSVPKTEDAFA